MSQHHLRNQHTRHDEPSRNDLTHHDTHLGVSLACAQVQRLEGSRLAQMVGPQVDTIWSRLNFVRLLVPVPIVHVYATLKLQTERSVPFCGGTGVV
jgi:hypothetical protein